MRSKVVRTILWLLSVAGVAFTGMDLTCKSVSKTYPVLLQVVSCEGTVQDGFTVKLKKLSRFCVHRDLGGRGHGYRGFLYLYHGR